MSQTEFIILPGLLLNGEKYIKRLPEAQNFDQTDRDLWEKLYKVDDKRIYEIKKDLKKNLFSNIRKRLQTDMMEKHVSPRTLLEYQQSS